MTVTTRLPAANATTALGRQRYLTYLVLLMGLVAVMDQYISTIKTTAIPYILQEYHISAASFSALEALYLAPTFLVVVLNGLNDIIGRRRAILVLVLLMGLSCLAMVYLTPSLTLFMALYALAMLTTVSNMWTIPISEEAPAQNRARYVAAVYVIGLIPLQAAVPPLVLNVLGLSWKWMYGFVFVLGLLAISLWGWMRETHRFAQIQRERREGTRGGHLFGIGSIDRRDLRYVAISASIWVCWLMNSMLLFWSGYFFMTIRGYTLGQWSGVLLATLVLAMAGGALGGWVMDRVGRGKALIVACLGLALTMSVWGFVPQPLLSVVAPASGFFASLSYTWVVVYVPEVFPTERRGACMGWTTTAARVSYIAGPLLAAVLLRVFPTMEWFWVVAGAIMLLPPLILHFTRPYETKTQELEDIERCR